MWTVNGAAMTRFAKGLGTPDWAFGIMAALPFVGAFFQLPASYIQERWGHRKALFMFTATTHRLMWVLVAAVPWLPGIDGYRWQIMIGVLAVNWAMGSAAGPAWMSWMADVIPRKIRGRYFGLRNRIGQSIGVITTLCIALILDHSQRGVAPSDATHRTLVVTSFLLALAGLFGALDIQSFARVRDNQGRPPAPRMKVLPMLAGPWRDPFFRRFLAYNFTLTLAIAFIGQYVWLYVLDVLKMDNFQAHLLIIALPLLVQLTAYPIWGGLMDRLGKKPVLLICGSFMVFGAVGWLMMGPDAADDWQRFVADRDWHGMGRGLIGYDWSWRSRIGYLMILMTTAAWPGVEVANFNMLLDMSGGSRRAEKAAAKEGQEDEKAATGGTAYIAINSIAVAIGGTISGLMASSLTGLLKDRMVDLPPILGIVLTYHGVLFGISTLLRAVAMGLATGLHEPTATGTRAALQFMTGMMYSNVREAVSLPTRIVGRAYRWSFLLSLPLKKRIRFGRK